MLENGHLRFPPEVFVVLSFSPKIRMKGQSGCYNFKVCNNFIRDRGFRIASAKVLVMTKMISKVIIC